jgi:hypothetical protein
MNVARFVGKDDRWEQITCHENGWEYKQIPPKIMNRWAANSVASNWSL